MRKVAVALLLLLAVSAVVATGGVDQKRKKHGYILDCDEDTDDCDLKKNPKPEKVIHEVEVEVPEGEPREPKGPVRKIPRPMFNPIPSPVPKEKKEKKPKMKEDKIVDDTEKPDFEPTLIPLPEFNPVPVPVPKEKKEKVKWEKEDKIVDDTEKREVDGEIPLPIFRPKPSPIPKEPKKRTKWIEEPIKDVTISPKDIYKHDVEETEKVDWKHMAAEDKKEAYEEIKEDKRHHKEEKEYEEKEEEKEYDN